MILDGDVTSQVSESVTEPSEAAAYDLKFDGCLYRYKPEHKEALFGRSGGRQTSLADFQ
jgi:hypothetical protein